MVAPGPLLYFWVFFNVAVLLSELVCFLKLMQEQRTYRKTPKKAILDFLGLSILPWFQQTARGRRLSYATCILMVTTFASFIGFFQYVSGGEFFDSLSAENLQRSLDESELLSGKRGFSDLLPSVD